MTAEERRKQRNKEIQSSVVSPAKGEIVGVARESLKRAIDSPITLEEVEQQIYNAVEDFNASNGVRDWGKESQRRFSALCMYIGEKVINPKRKDIIMNSALRDTGSATLTANNKIDIDSLASLYDIFVSIAVRCDKCPTRWAFQFFCGLSHDYINHMGNKENATSSEIELYKKIITNEESTNMDSLLGGRQNVVGVIFAGKNLYGWRDVKEVAHTTDTRRTMEDIAVSMGLGLPDSGNSTE